MVLFRRFRIALGAFLSVMLRRDIAFVYAAKRGDVATRQASRRAARRHL